MIAATMNVMAEMREPSPSLMIYLTRLDAISAASG